MSLTASMWTGVSGLLGHGEKMNVVGHNIANVSTVGYKAQRMDVEDFIYATTHSASGPAQIGRGVDIGIIMGDFSQGSFESTTSAVELAIGGSGFFKVQPIGTEQAYYTRAGNFHFNIDGYLIDPHGYALQGWKIDNSSGPVRAAGGAGPSEGGTSPIKGAGVPRDVRLDTWTVPPKQTTKTSIITNLAADAGDNSRNAPNPFAALIQSWDGTQPPVNNRPTIAQDSFAYTTSIKVYDESGLQHVMTIYYDKVDPNSYDGKSGETMWEYIVTMDPAEDKRQVWDTTKNNGAGGLVDVNTTKMGGLLMAGVMTFNAAGTVIDQTAYTLLGNIPYFKDPLTGDPVENQWYHWDKNPPPPGEKRALVPVVGSFTDLGGGVIDDIVDLDSWQGITQALYPASVSQTGYPMLVANFGGVGGAQTSGSPKGDSYLMEFNLGLRVTDYAHPWTASDYTNLYQSTKLDPLTDFPPDNLTQNEFYTKDNQNGPKVVRWNDDPTIFANGVVYSEVVMNRFHDAILADIASGDLDRGNPAHFGPDGELLVTPGPAYPALDAWATWALGLTDSSSNPLYADINEVYYATWPYMTVNTADMSAKGFQNILLDNSKFENWTPNTTKLAFINGTAQVDPNHTTMLGTTYATGNGTGQNGYSFGNLTGYNV
ncbi:MAG: flagellar hook-basal body complex protein, partial [Deltaproteobacteria bacterium]|nr:flagellar hook-basal body complex protein [Deltaproteobacteria bacterium]